MNLRISAGSRHDMNHRYMMLYAYVHLDEFYWLVKEIIPKCPQFRYFHVFELHHNSAIYTLWMYMNVSDLTLCIEMISAHALDVHHDGVFSCGVGAEVPPCCGFHREGDGHISEQHGSCTLQFQWWQNSTMLPCCTYWCLSAVHLSNLGPFHQQSKLLLFCNSNIWLWRRGTGWDLPNAQSLRGKLVPPKEIMLEEQMAEMERRANINASSSFRFHLIVRDWQFFECTHQW